MATPYFKAGNDGKPLAVVQGEDVTSQHKPRTKSISRSSNNKKYRSSGCGSGNKNDQQQCQEPFDPLGYLKHQATASIYECGEAVAENYTCRDGGEAIPIPKSERRCHDAFWAILFYVQMGLFVWCTITYTPQLIAEYKESDANAYEHQGGANNNNVRRFLLKATRFLDEQQAEDGGNNGDDYYDAAYNYNYDYNYDGQQQAEEDGGAGGGDNNNYDASYSSGDGGGQELEFDVDMNSLLVIVCVSTAMSLVISSMALGFMMSFSQILVKMSLFFNVALFAMMAIISLVIGALPMGLVSLMLTGVMVYYAFRVWDRIPFAAANLSTAVTAVRANLGLTFYSYLAVVTVFLWSIWWSVASMSTIYVTNGCQADGNCESDVNAGIVFLFLLAYYWTTQVISNVVHCSTAGTVGAWWFSPAQANGCCSRAVRDSYVRSLTLSFGSICFASLIVAIIQAIREFVQMLRDNGDSFIVCCAECLLACIESLVEIFNRFALIYVAVHGQSFLSAGRSVVDLFRARGWTSIITDYMVDTVLSMMACAVGLLVGVTAIVIAAAMQGSSQTILAAFVVGFVVGYAVCATLLSVVSSAVNTVIVLYAEAPNEFQANHPELSNRMRAAWRQAWPNEFSY